MNERPPTSDTSHTISRSFRIELDIPRSSPRRALNRQGMRGHPCGEPAEARCADNKQCCRLSARETLRGEDTRIAAATRGRSTRAEVDGHARESTPSSGRDQGAPTPKMGTSVAVLRPSLDSDDRPNGRLSLQARKSSHTSQARVGEKANLSSRAGRGAQYAFRSFCVAAR